MLLSIYQFSVIHVLESSVKCIARYWFMASSVQKSNNYMEVSFHEFLSNQKLLQMVSYDLWPRNHKIVVHGI